MERTPPTWLKPVVDYAPLAVFLIAYMSGGLMTATAALIASTAVVLVVSLVVARRLPLIPLITALVVGIFGGLTLWLNDDSFIKMKPTIVYVLMAAVLGGGMATGRTFLKSVMGEAISLDDIGWRRLTTRFILFFVAMAAFNEVARRVLTTDMWVLWKVPGSIGLTFVFMLFQAPFIKRHQSADRG